MFSFIQKTFSLENSHAYKEPLLTVETNSEYIFFKLLINMQIRDFQNFLEKFLNSCMVLEISAKDDFWNDYLKVSELKLLIAKTFNFGFYNLWNILTCYCFANSQSWEIIFISSFHTELLHHFVAQKPK